MQVLTQMLVAESGLSKAVFDSPYAEAAFDEIVSKHTIDRTKFGQAILQSKRLPDKVVLLPPPLSSPKPCAFFFHLWLACDIEAIHICQSATRTQAGIGRNASQQVCQVAQQMSKAY